MAQLNTKLNVFIAEEVAKVKGLTIPIRSTILERALIRKVKCTKLHPNPDDEFCFPSVGPNEEIVSKYVHEFRNLMDSSGLEPGSFMCNEPLDVQKIHPDGYMILNGHHRWAAAVLFGVTKLRVNILNLAWEQDIRKILEQSKHDQRITLDLDEIILAPAPDGKMEKPLCFPFNRIFKQQIRLGIPSLFSFFASRGYDVWVYTSGFKSVDYIRELLCLYHAHVTGIVTGTPRKTAKESAELEKLFSSKYQRTIHIDNDSVLCVDRQTKDYHGFHLNPSNLWSAEVMDAMKAVARNV